MLVERNPKLLEAVKYNAAPTFPKIFATCYKKSFLDCQWTTFGISHNAAAVYEGCWFNRTVGSPSEGSIPSDYVCSSVQIALFRQNVRLKH